MWCRFPQVLGRAPVTLLLGDLKKGTYGYSTYINPGTAETTS
jgi:hypothetical protein